MWILVIMLYSASVITTQNGAPQYGMQITPVTVGTYGSVQSCMRAYDIVIRIVHSAGGPAAQSYGGCLLTN